MPPWIAIVYAESPAHGISLFVPGGARQEDLDSFLLSHVAAILSAHAPFKSALCLAAASYFERKAQQTVAVLLLGLDVCDNGDGTYEASVTVPLSGTYVLQALLDGRPICGSPHRLLVGSGTDIECWTCFDY